MKNMGLVSARLRAACGVVDGRRMTLRLRSGQAPDEGRMGGRATCGGETLVRFVFARVCSIIGGARLTLTLGVQLYLILFKERQRYRAIFDGELMGWYCRKIARLKIQAPVV
jgi:hypothetical protein